VQLDDADRPWIVPESAPGSNAGPTNLERHIEGRQADVILLKMLLCAAFYPNFLISVPEDKVRGARPPRPLGDCPAAHVQWLGRGRLDCRAATQREMHYAYTAGLAGSLNYDPWRTFALRRSAARTRRRSGDDTARAHADRPPAASLTL